MTLPDAAPLRIQLVPPRPRFDPLRALGWVALLATLVTLAAGGYLTWRWADDHLFSLGIQDAGQAHVDSAALLERVHTLDLVTVRDTYDTHANTEFHKRLNAGLATFELPGWVAGQELDVHAKVTVSAGVDLSQVAPEDITVTAAGRDATVTIAIPEARVTSTEIDPSAFDITTHAGLLTRLRKTVGLGERDVRDQAVGAVTSVARDEALREGVLEAAGAEARARLQALLQSLPQPPGGAHVTYAVATKVLPR